MLKERIVSNLFSVIELPSVISSVETPFRTEAEVTEACGGPGPLPFLLKGPRLYTVAPLTEDSIFAPAMSKGQRPMREDFRQWFHKTDRAAWGIEVLDSLFRNHAWTRGLRFDESRRQYYFPRSKPKTLWWRIGDRTIESEVTAPHLESAKVDSRTSAQAQYGWRHRSIRANFILISGSVFLRLEPTWHLTNLDDRSTPSQREVAPSDAHSLEQERNGRLLLSLWFWSAVLAKGHHELRINTASSPVRTRLTPLSGLHARVSAHDHVDYDALMLRETGGDQSIPDLRPMAQESAISHEEELSSDPAGRPWNLQAAAHF